MADTTKKTENNNPDYIVYFVPNRRNAFWTKIGAAWNHKDGKGMNIEQDFTPIGDGRIVLRDYAEAMKEQEETSTKKTKGEPYQPAQRYCPQNDVVQ